MIDVVSFETVRGLDAERATIETYARRAYPDEACGVVMARPGLRLVLACANMEPETQRRVRYHMSGADLERIARLAHEGHHLDTIWHSHPDHPAAFSSVDVAAAMLDGEPLYPWTIYKVVAVEAGEPRDWDAVRWDATARAFVRIPAWTTTANAS